MVRPATFQGLAKLERLNMRDCTELRHVEAGAFARLSNLHSLNLSGAKKLSAIKSNVFSPLTALKLLDLSLCNIQHIDPDAFNNLKNLENLNLRDNDLLAFETGCTPWALDLANNRENATVRFTGGSLWRIDEIRLDASASKLVASNFPIGGVKQPKTARKQAGKKPQPVTLKAVLEVLKAVETNATVSKNRISSSTSLRKLGLEVDSLPALREQLESS